MDTAGTNGHKRPLKVAIIGGGVCGLAAAIGLIRAGLDVDIYESATKLGEIGAGVGLGPNAVRVLKELNILEEVVASVFPEKPAPRLFRFLFGTGDQEVIYDYPVGPEDDGLGIHRVTFIEALIHLVDPSKIHCKKRCIGIRALPSGRVQVIFSDGTSAEADVVVGADGVRSIVRTYVLEGETAFTEGVTSGSANGNPDVGGTEGDLKAPPTSRILRVKFTNYTAYRGLVPVEKLKSLGVKIDLSDRLHCFIGDCKHILTFPIKGGTVINVVAFSYDSSILWDGKPLPPGTPWVAPRSTEELLATYEGWSEDVRLLLGCISSPSVWSIHAVDPPLDSFIRGRVALVGDSAHAMLPYLGAGAGQALEDALVLVKLLALSQTTAENVEEVLKAYDTVRRPRANMVLTQSTLMGLVYDCLGPSGATKEGIRTDLEEKWDDVWSHDVLKDVDAAVVQLEEKGVFVK
ncbi:hypothetical protein ACEPAI_5355 [Sanghuangporus weigelae]